MGESSLSMPARSLGGVLREIAADIKIAHSIFALPFALLGAVMAAAPAGGGIEWRRFAGQAALVIGAMVCARTVAMLANRYLDREIDARNPRTQGRAIPAGRLSAGSVQAAIIAFGAAFLLVCSGFGAWFGNWWPLVLGLPVLAWISAYGWLKRFTSLCHLYLGSSLAISPLAAAIAVDPAAVGLGGVLAGASGGGGVQPGLFLLCGMVLCWVAGFDIIYALQDVAVDRAQGLHSIPSRLGIGRAMWVSRGLHAAAVLCLGGLLAVDNRLGVVFAAGVALVLALLIYEHATVARWGTTRLALAFFTLNGLVSCVVGGLGVADVLAS